MLGPKQFVVRGIMKAGGMASAFGGSFAIMDVYAAEKIFGRGRRFDRFRSKRVRVALFLLAGAARYAHDELPLDHLAERVL